MPKVLVMPIRVIARISDTCLVEWIEGGSVKRGLVPLELGDKETLTKAEIEAAVPYGVPWEELVKPQATAEALAKHLRNSGIFTYEDAVRNTSIVLGAIQATYQVDLATILAAARKFEEKE